MRTSLIALALSIACVVTSGHAESFQTVRDKSEFVGLVAGKKLKRFGVELAVMPAGEIAGSAFGRTVRGAWRWDGDYFCRDLSFGSRDLGPNCQLVRVNGDTIRFIADRGAGDSADLRIE